MKKHSPGKKFLSFVCALAILIAQIPAIQLFANATTNESVYFSLANMQGGTAGSVTANRWYCTDPNQFGMIMSGWGINQLWGHISATKQAAGTVSLVSSGSIPAGLTYLFATTAPNAGAPKTGTQPLKVPVNSKLDFSISSDQPYKIVITYGTKPLDQCSTANDGGDGSAVDADNYGYLQILKDGAVDNKKATGYWDDGGFYLVSNLDTGTLIPAGHHSYSIDLSGKLASHAPGTTDAYIYAISIVTAKPNSLNMVIDQFDLKSPSAVIPATSAGAEFFSVNDFTADKGTHTDGGLNLSGGNRWYCTENDFFKALSYGWGVYTKWDYLSVVRTDNGLTLSNNGSEDSKVGLTYLFGTSKHPSGGEFSVGEPLKVPVDSTLDLAVNSSIPFKFVVSYGTIHPTTGAITYGFLEIGKSGGNYAVINSSASDYNAVQNQWPADRTTNLIPAGEHSVSLPLNAIANGVEGCTHANIYGISVVVYEHDPHYGYKMDISRFSLKSASPVTSASAFGESGTIAGNSIRIDVPYGTDLSAVIPSIDGATVVSPTAAQDFSKGPVTYTVDKDGVKYTYLIAINMLPADDDCDITAAKIAGYDAAISGTNITVELPINKNLTALEPVFTYPSTATIDKSGPQDFSSPVVYTVTAQDGHTQKQYTVSASFEAVNYLDFSGITANAGSRPDDIATTNAWYCGDADPIKYPFHSWGLGGMWGHISVAKNSDGVLTIANNGGDINPDVIRYSFGAEAYSASVPPPAIAIQGKYLYMDVTSKTEFKLVIPFSATNGVTNDTDYGFVTVVQDANGQLAMAVSRSYDTLPSESECQSYYNKSTGMIPAGSYKGLLPMSDLRSFTDNCSEIRLYAFDVVVPAGNALNINLDFQVPSALSTTACDILSCKINGTEAAIDGTGITVELPHGTDLTNLTAEYTLSPLAALASADVKDFSNPVTLTVTALDGVTTKVYTVTVTTAAAPSVECDILSASINGTACTISGTDITVKLPVGTDFSKLEPVFTISDNATISPDGTQDFSEPVVYTVTAQDGVTKQQYTVIVAFEDVTITEPGDITADSGSRNEGIIAHNCWYCTDHNGTIDPSKAWGMDGMWGHIQITKNDDGSTVIHNNGTDVNPALIRYSFGTEENGTPPGKTAISGKYLYIHAKSATKFKFVIPYAAVNAVTGEKTYAFAVITENTDGKYVIKTSVLAGDGQPAPAYSKQTDMMRAGAHEGMIALSELGKVTENCSEIYIFAWDIVAEDGKALDLSFSFKAPSAFGSTDCDIVAFRANGIAGTIKDTDITITVPYSTDLKNIVTQITTSVGATVSPANIKDFSSPVALTVTAPDGKTTKVYTVTVNVAKAKYADIGIVSSNNGVELEGGKIVPGAWYANNLDAVTYPFAGWGLSPMWGHLSLSVKNRTVYITNNGNDVNPPLFRYVFGTDNRCDPPSKPVSVGDLLHIEAKSDQPFKLIVAFAAVDPITGAKKYGLMEIYPDEDGNLVTALTDADMTGSNGHAAVYDKTTHLFEANVAYEADVLLSDLAHGIEGCSEAYIYSIDVVTAAEKAFTMKLNFTPDSYSPATADNSHIFTLMAVSLMAACSLAVLLIYRKKSIAS